MKRHGFSRYESDHSFLTSISEVQFTIILVYVDYILVI